MNNEQIPDWPEWIRELFTERMTCPHCKHRLRLEHVVGIGINFSHASWPFDRQPIARIIVVCDQCFKNTDIEMIQDKESILMGVDAVFNHIESQREFTEKASPFLPSPNLDPPPADDEDHLDVIPNKTSAEKRMDTNRSRRKAHLKKPPGDREVETFLNKLKATSFKRSSKSYRKFMRALGIDIPNEDKEK